MGKSRAAVAILLLIFRILRFSFFEWSGNKKNLLRKASRLFQNYLNYEKQFYNAVIVEKRLQRIFTAEDITKMECIP